MKVLRIGVLADSHCGHEFGLVPRQWEGQTRGYSAGAIGHIQRSFWKWYEAEVATVAPVDVLVCNGDLIDGRGERSNGQELIVSSIDEQIEMAYRAAALWRAGRVAVIAGTPYHTGAGEEKERLLAQRLGGTFHAEHTLQHGPCRLHFRHPVGGGTAAGRVSTLLRDQIARILYDERIKRPERYLVVRSHAHAYLSVATSAGRGLITPGLQLRTRYGNRLDGHTDVGFAVLTVGEEISVDVRLWRHRLLQRIAELASASTGKTLCRAMVLDPDSLLHRLAAKD